MAGKQQSFRSININSNSNSNSNINSNNNGSNKDTIKKYILVALCALVIIIILFAIFSGGSSFANIFDKFSSEVSTVDGHKYEVRPEPVKDVIEDKNNNQADRQLIIAKSHKMAADYLAKLKQRVDILVNYMHENDLPDLERAQRVYSNWKKCVLKETGSSENSVAYTINKGSEMRICIRANGELEDFNTSMFVILHELAHVMSVSYNHTDEFKDNFSYIVHLASSLGLYKPQDFHEKPVNYCGMEINTTPCSNNTCTFNDMEKK